jgi:hypothetical protein
MNVNSIAGALQGARMPQVEPRQRAEQDAAARAAAQAQQAPVAAPRVDPLRAPQQALPAEPPAGTDPELWSVLTQEERAFFAKAGAMGPLTYGHVLSSQNVGAPASRGGRLDVRA